MNPKLTIGMAVYDDFDGVYFTVQALRMYHSEVLQATEFIVVDNNPSGKHGPHIKNYVESVGGRYIPMPEATGTTQPRNRIFKEARGEYAMCMDSHVLLVPGSLNRLLNWYATTGSGSRDLISGPMLYDRLDHYNTHFDNVWRSEMWGVWGNAFSCSCSPKEEAAHFTPLKTNEQCDYRSLDMELTPRTACPLCGKPYPAIPHPGHERQLINAGFLQLGNTEEAFAIPGNGLGLFTCRREAWLGFSEHFRGFGGEEMYIHEKYRKAGHKALCLPFLKWGHRFGRPNGTPYGHVLTRYNKIRNYIIGALEVGYGVARTHEHFVAGNLCPQWEWDFILRNAMTDPSIDRKPTVGDAPPEIREQLRKAPPPSGLPQPRATISDLGELMTWARTTPRDLDKHLEKIGQYALRCKHVTEVTHRRESTIALLYAKQRVVSFQAERDILIPKLIDMFPNKLDVKLIDITVPPKLTEETELLFLDTIQTYDRLKRDLAEYAPLVAKYIIIHDTHLYAEKGQIPNTKGLLPALRVFMRANPEWSVVYHTTEEYGLTVLSRVASEKEKLPSYAVMATNLAKASAAFIADGAKTVTKEQYNQRLEICSLCEHRNENRCALCGCGLTSKATGRAFECPIGKWPDLRAAEVPAS